MKTIYEFSVKDRKGGNVSLKEYANEFCLSSIQPLSADSRLSMKNLRRSMRSTTHKALPSSTSPVTSLANRHQAPTKAFTNSAN